MRLVASEQELSPLERVSESLSYKNWEEGRGEDLDVGFAEVCLQPLG
jgi:hypothetical protein